MGLNLFFSYSEKDMSKYHIAQIAKLLKKTPEIDDIFFYHGKTFNNIYEYIEESLEKTDVLLLFCSEHTKVSDYVKIEWQGALESKKKIIPIYETEDFIPYSLRGQIRAKFNQDDTESFVDEIYQILLKAFDIKPKIEKEVKLKFYKGHYLPEAEISFLEHIEGIADSSFEFVQHMDEIYNTYFEKIGLILENKRITGIGIKNIHLKTIPESLRKFEKLYILNLENVGLKKIPDWINELKLDFLCLNGNELEELPNSITDLNYLGILDLSNNSLSSIPESLGNMGFQFLNLDNNQLKTIPLSFLNIEVDELELQGNPFVKNPNLRMRFIIESLKRRGKIDIDLPKFKFEFGAKNGEISDKVEDLIHDYRDLNIVDPGEMWRNQEKQEKICYEILDLGYSALDYLIDVYLMGYIEIQPIAGEIIDFILCDIEPNWREIILNEN